jgi:hypothetical protein
MTPKSRSQSEGATVRVSGTPHHGVFRCPIVPHAHRTPDAPRSRPNKALPGTVPKASTRGREVRLAVKRNSSAYNRRAVLTDIPLIPRPRTHADMPADLEQKRKNAGDSSRGEGMTRRLRNKSGYGGAPGFHP